MPKQPTVDKTKNFTEPELILSYLIDNQMISGPEAIILLKAILENQKKEPEPMLYPREEKEPISIPSINPLEPVTTILKPYNPLTNPMRIWCESDKNCLNTAYDMNNATSITSDEVKPNYSTSTEDIFPFPESQVFNKKN